MYFACEHLQDARLSGDILDHVDTRINHMLAVSANKGWPDWGRLVEIKVVLSELVVEAEVMAVQMEAGLLVDEG